MESIPQKHEWQIRQAGVLSAPMTESQMRKQLMQVALGEAWVRQGESQWVRAASIIAKLEKLDSDGVYLRSLDDQNEPRTVGPFTPTRAYKLLCDKNIDKLEARVGREAPWRPAAQVLKHIESVLAKPKGKSDRDPKPAGRNHMGSRDLATDGTPSVAKKDRSESKRMQTCPHCAASLNVARFPNGKNIACGSCSQQFTVSRETASHAGHEKPVVVNPVRAMPALKVAVPLPGPVFDDAPVFDSVQLPPPAKASPQSPAASPANPYNVPPQRSAYQQHRVQGPSTAKYIVPGVFISLWGAIVLVASLIRLAAFVYVMSQLGTQMLKPYFLGKITGEIIIGLSLSVCMIVGGINMIRRKGLNSARIAAVLATVPCIGIFVFPIGIWACVTLFSKQGEADFG